MTKRKEQRQFKPGPYTLCKDKDGCDDVWHIYAAGQTEPFATLPYWDCDSEWTSRATATARLLAAAPELFEALEVADTCLGLLAGSKYSTSELCRDVRDVLSKVLEHDYLAEREASIQDQNLYWGRCPQCGKSDGYLSIGRVHWFYCEAHRVKWCAGENLFSSWRADTDEDRKKNAAFLRDFQEIKPD
jgi:hypothetical protein